MNRTRAVLAITLTTLLLAGTVIAGFSGRATTPETIPVALVNLDEPVTTGEGEDRTTIAAGRQLAADLTTGEQSVLDWTLVDGDALGSSDTVYYAVVTIPEEFSAVISGLADSTADTAQITIDTAESGTAGPATERIASAVTDSAVDTFNDDVTSAYLENVYVSYNSINHAVADSADGATELHTSAADLAGGAAQLAAGTDDVASGADQLAAAARDLTSGTEQLATGTEDLATGTESAAAAASSLSAGASDLRSATSDLAAGATSLDKALEEGAAAAETSLEPAAAGSAEQSAALAATLGGLATTCPPTTPAAYCAAVAAAADDAVAAAQSAGLTSAAAGQTADGWRAGADAASDLADGATSVSTGADEIASGATQLADATTDLEEGAGSVSEAAADVAAGTTSVADAAGDLTAGATSAADAADDVAEGADGIAGGAASLTDGLTQLEDTVPTYPDEADREELADAVAAPSGTASSSAAETGALAFLALAVAVALWVGVGASFAGRPAIPGWALAAGGTATRAVLLGLLPRIGLAIIAAVALWGLALIVGLDRSAAGPTLLLMLFGAVSVTAVLQAVFAVAGRAGYVVLTLLLAVQLAAAGLLFPATTMPPFLQHVGGWLPLTALIRSVNGTVTAGPSTTLAAVLVLLIWAGTAMGICVLVARATAHRRH